MITVCIDAGHGGSNMGAIYDEIVEKDYNLELSQHLYLVGRNLPGISIWPTRPADIFLSFLRRGKISKENAADLVISLHVNANSNRGVDGAECYILPDDSVARRVGRSILLSLPNEMLHSGRRPMCEPIVAENKPESAADDWLERPARVLRPYSCPAVLFEVGYASNERDYENLRTDCGKMHLITAVLSGISEFMRISRETV